MTGKTKCKRLHEECHETKDITKEKTKTKTILTRISEEGYKKQPRPEILKLTKHETKTIVIARYGMLQCGKNYKGTMSEICKECNILDDENHRLNYCLKWKDRNNLNENVKIDFDLVFSERVDELRHIIQNIEKLWNTRNAHGSMNIE